MFEKLSNVLWREKSEISANNFGCAKMSGRTTLPLKNNLYEPMNNLDVRLGSIECLELFVEDDYQLGFPFQ